MLISLHALIKVQGFGWVLSLAWLGKAGPELKAHLHDVTSNNISNSGLHHGEAGQSMAWQRLIVWQIFLGKSAHAPACEEIQDLDAFDSAALILDVASGLLTWNALVAFSVRSSLSSWP